MRQVLHLHERTSHRLSILCLTGYRRSAYLLSFQMSWEFLALQRHLEFQFVRRVVGGQVLQEASSSDHAAAAAALITVSLTDLAKDQIDNSGSRPCSDFIPAESSSSSTESFSSSVDSSGSCNTAETPLPTLQQANQRRPGTLDEGLAGRNPSYACTEVIGISTVASSHERDNVVPGPNYRTLGANEGDENLEQTDGHPIEEWTANTATRNSPPLLR